MKQQLRILTCLTIIGGSTSAYAQVTLPKTEIENFINYVWEFNPSISESLARVSIAEAKKRAVSKWQHNPELEFNIEDIDGEDKTKTIGISQTIDLNGKFMSSGKTALFELQAVQSDRDAIRQNVALEVLTSLSNYRTGKDTYDLSVERTELMTRFSALAQKGFNAGDIDQSEKNLAQLALSEALILQADAQNTLAQSEQELSTAIGFSLDNGFVLPELPDTLPELPDVIDEDQILLNLPSLRAMRSREEAAMSLVENARKDRFPDVTIGITGGQDGGADVVGLSVSVPLNIFNTYGAEVDQAKAYALAEATAGQTAIYRAKTRLKTARISYQLSRKAWINWQENGAQSLSKQADLLNRKFKIGDLSATNYLVQIEQALDTQVATEELHNKVWKSWFSWLGASGTINQWLKNSGE